MKLKIHDKPGLAAALMSAVALLLWAVFDAPDGPRWIALPFALLYSLLALLCLWAWLRTFALERRSDWPKPERLLILAPHEDDCVISAGGIGARNVKLGGVTRVLHLAPDETPGMAAIRNAVYQAIGIRFNHLPMSPPKVLDALESVALRKAAD